MEIEQYIVSTDQQLVERALDGDTVAFEHLFNRYRDSIYQLYVQRTSGRTDDASDLLQETFVKVYLNMQRYDSRYTFGQWVYTIARNTFIDYMRRKRDDTVPIDRIGERVSSSWGGPTPEERMITDQSRARLESLLERMSPRYRKLIELRFFKEYSYEEIAAELQLPMGTVKTQIHRARTQLCKLVAWYSRTILQQEHEPDADRWLQEAEQLLYALTHEPPTAPAAYNIESLQLD